MGLFLLKNTYKYYIPQLDAPKFDTLFTLLNLISFVLIFFIYVGLCIYLYTFKKSLKKSHDLSKFSDTTQEGAERMTWSDVLWQICPFIRKPVTIRLHSSSTYSSFSTINDKKQPR